MSNILSASALAARLSLQKLYTHNQYNTHSSKIASYSKILSKKLSEYGAIDLLQSNMLQSLVFPLLEEEYRKNGGKIEDQSLVKVTTYNVIFDISEKVVDARTMKTLISFQKLESFIASFLNNLLDTKNLLDNALTAPAAQLLSEAFNIEKLAWVSAKRAKELAQYLEMIQNGTFWKKDKEQTWVCANCGNSIKSFEAFEECACCHAKRENALTQ